MVIAAVIIFLVLFLIFSIKYFVEAKVREVQRGALSKEKEISEGAVRRMTIVDSYSLGEGGGGERDSKTPSFSIGDDKDSVDSPATTPPSASSSKEVYKISFEGVGMVLKTGVKIMSGVSGEFLPMRTCAIMGPSGAGKVRGKKEARLEARCYVCSFLLRSVPLFCLFSIMFINDYSFDTLLIRQRSSIWSLERQRKPKGLSELMEKRLMT
jgi:hypothetical protein